MAFASVVNANAQAEREFFVSVSANPLTAVKKQSNVSISETETYHSFSLGFNHLNPFTANEKIWTSLGGGFSWVRLGGGNNFFRLQFPLSFKYKAKTSEHLVLEPYAGLTGTLNFFYCSNGSCGSWGNRVNVGWHAGFDFIINNFVIGLGYEKDFTNFESYELNDIEAHSRWSSISLKFGFRFE